MYWARSFKQIIHIHRRLILVIVGADLLVFRPEMHAPREVSASRRRHRACQMGRQSP
jgi:hypothetical protein